MEDKKEVEIIAVPNMEGAIACWNPVSNIIYYDQDLNHYPELKEKVLKHEQGHTKFGLNIVRHVLHDCVDYTRLHIRYDFYKYHFLKDHDRDNPKHKAAFVPLLLYTVIISILSILLTVVQLAGIIIWTPYYLYQRIRRNKNGEERKI